jgi:hypothetical protein
MNYNFGRAEEKLEVYNRLGINRGPTWIDKTILCLGRNEAWRETRCVPWYAGDFIGSYYDEAMLAVVLLIAGLVLNTNCRRVMSAVPLAPIGSAKDEGTSGEQARTADSFLESLGVNVHLTYFDTGYGDFEVIKKRLVDLGVRHLRDGAQFTGDHNYNNIFYGRLKDLANSGIKFDLIFDPRSSVGQLTEKKLSAVVAMAGNSLEAVEGPNEYDNSVDRNWAYTLREYQALLYQTVKVNPATRELPVIGPSFVHAESRDAIGDLAAYLDYGNLHSYPGGRMPTSSFQSGEEILRARKVSGARPLIPTETGYHTAVGSRSGQPGISDQAFAKYLPRLYLEYFNQGFARTYLYELSDEKPDPERVNPEHDFGLLTSSGEPNPAYFSLRNLISIVAETREGDTRPPFTPGQLSYRLRGDTSGIHHSLLQKRDGRFYLILWHEASSYDSVAKSDTFVPVRRLVLELSQARQVNSYLPLKSSQVVEHDENSHSIELDVPDHALVIEIVL